MCLCGPLVGCHVCGLCRPGDRPCSKRQRGASPSYSTVTCCGCCCCFALAAPTSTSTPSCSDRCRSRRSGAAPMVAARFSLACWRDVLLACEPQLSQGGTPALPPIPLNTARRRPSSPGMVARSERGADCSQLHGGCVSELVCEGRQLELAQVTSMVSPAMAAAKACGRGYGMEVSRRVGQPREDLSARFTVAGAWHTGPRCRGAADHVPPVLHAGVLHLERRLPQLPGPGSDAPSAFRLACGIGKSGYRICSLFVFVVLACRWRRRSCRLR